MKIMLALLKISIWAVYWIAFCVPFTLCFMFIITINYLIKKLYNDTKNYLDSIHY
jgi:hypothetical protein